MRVTVFNLTIAAIFLFLALGTFNLEVIQGKNLRTLSDKNCIRLITQTGARGRILDRNGELIVGNCLSYDLMILPQEKNQLEKTLSAVSGVSGISLKDLKDRYRRGYVGPFVPVAVEKNIDTKKAIALGELKFDYSAIIIQPHPLRFYPYVNLASHVIGYLNEIDHWRLSKLEEYGYKTKDIVGFGGVEEKYDYYLRQTDGALSVEVDHRGRFIRMLGVKPPQDGKDIQLTLNLQVQKIVEEALSEKRGSVILMDPNTGEIIAMASSPNFDPAIFIKKSNYNINNLVNSALINRAISGAYPLASVFKLIDASGALEKGKINKATTYLCTGTTRVGNRDFSCWDKHGEESLLDAIVHSCDTFFYKVGLLLGPQLLHDYAVKFGLSKITGIDLPYEAAGLVPEPLWKSINRFQNWYDGDTANFSIGQGYVLVTPIQVASLISVFANKGMIVTPYVVRSVEGRDISAVQRKNAVIAVKKEAIISVRECLREVVAQPSGTASILSDLPVKVAGKTGTAQAAHNQTHGWFAGFFPFDNPRFAICVFLENNGSGFASCMVTKQIIERMVKENLI